MESTRQALRQLGLPPGDGPDLPTSQLTFPDGGRCRIEIPSVEGPQVLGEVIAHAGQLGVPVHRISQGSGIWLLTDSDLAAMAELGARHGIEVSLFVGPRAGWGTRALPAAAGSAIAGKALGMEAVVHCVEEVKRACRFGIRSVLVADEGVIWVLHQLRSRAELPPDLVIKVSVACAIANPVSARLIEAAGANTVNLPGDMTVAELSAVRTACQMVIDLYVEGPDDLGGLMRYYQISEIVRVASPVHLKFGLRNATAVYPSGLHLYDTAAANCREKVRRAAIGLEMLARYWSLETVSPVTPNRPGVPVVP